MGNFVYANGPPQHLQESGNCNVCYITEHTLCKEINILLRIQTPVNRI